MWLLQWLFNGKQDDRAREVIFIMTEVNIERPLCEFPGLT